MNLIALSTIREQQWQEAILRTANDFSLLPSQIVQDLLNWAFLKTLTEHTKQPYVFKGGTSRLKPMILSRAKWVIFTM